MSVENSDDGPAQKQSSGSIADTSEEQATPSTGSQELSSENDPSRVLSSQSSEPEKSGETSDRNRLQQILRHQFFRDDETEDDFKELIETTKKLIQEDSRTNTLGSAFSQAVQFGLKKSIEVMIYEIEMVGKDHLHGIVNWRDKNLRYWTPLHMACFFGRLDLVKLFLNNEADKEALDRDLRTPLHIACYYGKPDIVALLLDEKADILAQDNEKQTPLIVTIRERETSCMEELLKIKPQRKQRYHPGKDNKSALQWAIADGFTQGVVEMFEDPSDYPNDKDVRKAAKEVLAYAVCTEDDLIDQVEKVVKFLVQENLPLPKHPKYPDNPDAFLSWAVERYDRHVIAKQLLRRESRVHTVLSAIEEAACQRKPKVLWSLIAASPPVSETVNQIGAALTYFEGKAGRLDETRITTTSTNAKLRNVKQVSPTDHVIHILRNPPIGLLFGVHGKSELEAPKPDRGDIKVLQQLDKVIVAEFYGGRNLPVQSVHGVYDVVYSEAGPGALLKEAKELSSFTRRDQAAAAKFTWIHLPATNIKWMEDLSLKIMHKELKLSVEEVTNVLSFLRTTWFQVPDQWSETRIMRPQFKERSDHSTSRERRASGIKSHVPAESSPTPDSSVAWITNVKDRDSTSKTTPDVKNQNVPSFVASSAVYMPFLAFSTLSGTVENKDLSSGENWPVLSEPAEQRMDSTEKRYQNLIDCYGKSQTIHGCATLDEAYYHFATEREDPGVQKDRTARNRSQVVTKQFLRRRGKKVPSKDAPDNMKTYWPILRVNQIWIWTIANKWLISATSHQPNDFEQSWIDGFVQHLNRRLSTGGIITQPNSTSEMMRVMIDYCIGFYDRRGIRKYLDEETDRHEQEVTTRLSMRQIFSIHINHVGRTETDLFERLRREVERKSGINARVNIAKDALSIAEELLSEIRDVHDELNILRSIVNYQNIVQRQMCDEPSNDSALSSGYILSDIVDMEKLATRIHSAVDTTLSLSASHIANLQADEAAQQGKSLMMFTISTIIFLPMSFLTSLFALDIESFQNVPGWAFGVIFGVSSAFTVALTVFAFKWDLIKALPKMVLNHNSSQNEHKIWDPTSWKHAPNKLNRSIARFSTGAETVTVHKKQEGQSRVTRRSTDKPRDLEKGPV